MIALLENDLARELTRIADFHNQSVNTLINDVLKSYVNAIHTTIPSEHELTACLSDPDFRACATQVDRMRHIWGYIRKQEPKQFGEIAPGLAGKKRRYAAPSSVEIEMSGRSTDPKLLSTNDYWICGNAARALKRKVTWRLLKRMGFSRAAIRDAAGAI